MKNWSNVYTLVLSGILFTVSSFAVAQPLVQAVKAGDQDAAMALIRQEADVNEASVDGTTSAHWAVYNGDIELLERLIRAGANVSTQNDYGSSPMGEAAAIGDAELLQLLLDAGADVNSPNPEGQTALMAAVRTGRLDAAEMLIDAGADLNAVELWGGQTALMWAASRRQPTMVKLLIDNGADLDARAIARDWDRRVTSEPRVKEMLTGGFTPLIYAVRENCLECARQLIEAGADINKTDPDNVTPLILALINMRFDVAKYLVEAGADVNQWDIWGRSPLYAAADTNITPDSNRRDLEPVQETTTGLEVGRMLLERGANPNLQLKLYPPAREIVYDRGGDNAGLTTGTTVLLRAAYGGDVDFIDLLLEYDANVELANINGLNPMLALSGRAGTRGRGKVEEKVIQGMESLLAAGANIEGTNSGGETALHSSTRMGWGAVVRFLVEQHGADLNAKESRGLTPMDYATGEADSNAFGNFNIVGELPQMVVLLTELAEAQN